MECLIARHWYEILGLAEVNLGDHFFELGGNSFAAVRLVMALGEELGRDIPITGAGPILADLAAPLAVEHQQAAAFSHLVDLLPTQASCPNAFWFHPSGGNVLCYQDLATALAGRFNLVGVQAAKGAEQAEFSSFSAMVTSYLAAIRTRQPQGPYYLGGWFMGGVLAYACAQHLIQAGEQVAALKDIYACFCANIRLLHSYTASPLAASVPSFVAMAEQQVETRVAAHSATTSSPQPAQSSLWPATTTAWSAPPSLSRSSRRTCVCRRMMWFLLKVFVVGIKTAVIINTAAK